MFAINQYAKRAQTSIILRVSNHSKFSLQSFLRTMLRKTCSNFSNISCLPITQKLFPYRVMFAINQYVKRAQISSIFRVFNHSTNSLQSFIRTMLHQTIMQFRDYFRNFSYILTNINHYYKLVTNSYIRLSSNPHVLYNSTI